MPSAEERFRAKIERRGAHHVWTGARDGRGVGMVRIDGKLRTVQRAAWEFAHGPLPTGVRVSTCAGERACVRLDHLSVRPPSSLAPAVSTRRPKGSGSIRLVRRGVWQVVVTESRGTRRPARRRALTVHGDRGDAERAAKSLQARIRTDLGDLRVRELVGRLLEERVDDGDPGVERERSLLHELVEPVFGDMLASDLSPVVVERALAPVYRSLGAEQVRAVLGLVGDGYRWAVERGWCDEDPTAGTTVRTLM